MGRERQIKSPGTFLCLITDHAAEALWKHPRAMVLANVIAWRQRDSYWKGGDGVAFLGDHSEYHMTRKEYRTARKVLEEMGVAEFVSVPGRGTCARLTDRRVYDLSRVLSNSAKKAYCRATGRFPDGSGADLSDDGAVTSDDSGRVKGHFPDGSGAGSGASKERREKRREHSTREEETAHDAFERLMRLERFSELDCAEFRQMYEVWMQRRAMRHQEQPGMYGVQTDVEVLQDLDHCRRVGVAMALAEMSTALGRSNWVSFWRPSAERMVRDEKERGAAARADAEVDDDELVRRTNLRRRGAVG